MKDFSCATLYGLQIIRKGNFFVPPFSILFHSQPQMTMLKPCMLSPQVLLTGNIAVKNRIMAIFS